jgi:phosphate transport system permease protein
MSRFRLRKSARREIHLGDLVFSYFLRTLSFGLASLLAVIGFFLFRGAFASISRYGWSFVTESVWDPVQEIFGSAPVLYGTLVSSLIAVMIAAPLSVGIALFLNEVVPPKIGRAIGFLVEMLAAIPSVVYGLWGIFVLAPWLRTRIEPILAQDLGWIPIFSGPYYGVGMLAAGLILSIMIIPTVFSISREIFKTIPTAQREAALALGATRWEMMKISILGSSKSGIGGAIILGLGRALGETMAVTMVIGNRAEISASLLAPGQTMASVIANEYAEATSDIHLSALIEIGFLLFVVTFIINAFARLFILRETKS